MKLIKLMLMEYGQLALQVGFLAYGLVPRHKCSSNGILCRKSFAVNIDIHALAW
jgi:hypothetical protein